MPVPYLSTEARLWADTRLHVHLAKWPAVHNQGHARANGPRLMSA